MSAYGNLSKKEATRIVETVASLMEQSKGTAETTAATMIGNLKGQLTILKSALQELAIQISDALKPALSGIVSGMQSFVEKLQHMDESTRNNILSWGLFIAAIGPVLTIVGKMTSGFGLLFK
ncbi:MAG: phage tail tape measure protein, partial [Synergistaceae bacterium]|nr:phage tail tape measure protein [Synergistaceae bacterium]